jgi:phage-related tail fiber protein
VGLGKLWDWGTGLLGISGNSTDARAALGAQLEPGIVGYTAGSTPPPGWLKRNGAAVSRTTYAALFAAIGTTYGVGDGSTTFNLPEGRAEFDRGWDDGRGVDTGRVRGSAQAQQSPDHYHSIPFGWDGGNQGFSWNDGSGNPVWGSDVSVVGGSTFAGKTTGNTTITGRFARSNGKAGDTGQNVPRNVAYLPIIKY